VAAFLAVAVLADAFFCTGTIAQHRRAWRLRHADVAFGIRHDQPLWMQMVAPSVIIGFGAVSGAIAAVTGFPNVGVGILSIVSVLAFVGTILMFRMSPRGLTFEAGGLRLHVGGESFVITWTAVVGIDRTGPDHMQIILLRLADTNLIVASNESNKDRIRFRTKFLVQERRGTRGNLILMPWTGGLDGSTIARMVAAAMRGSADRGN
jgi:hypothetical protein